MTLIIGMKYKEGIVLIGDTKIIDGTNYHYENKIEAPVSGINTAVGSAGLTALAKDFNRKINDLVPQRIREYEMANLRELNGSPFKIEDIQSGKIQQPQIFVYNENKFLDDCAFTTNQVADTGRVYSQNPIESIVAINVNAPFLYQIDCRGVKIEVPYTSIGSGTDHIGDYLKRNYREGIELDEAIFLGSFLIKYVEVLGFDKNVGVEKGKLPQIFILTKDKCENYKVDENVKKNLLVEINSRIKRIRNALLLFKNENNNDYSMLSKGNTKGN